MQFEEKFPELYQFFAGYFHDADLMDQTDEQVIEEYLSVLSEKELNETIKELDDLIVEVDRFWKEATLSANRYFENSGEALAWLKMIRDKLIG